MMQAATNASEMRTAATTYSKPYLHLSYKERIECRNIGNVIGLTQSRYIEKTEDAQQFNARFSCISSHFSDFATSDQCVEDFAI